VPKKDRVTVEALPNNCFRIKLHFGFMDDPNVPKALELCKAQGIEFNNLETSFFLSRETVIPVTDGGMAMWREQLFVFMTRNTSSIVEYFNIPTNRVIELGTQIEI
jgi:KUP system potassium uptake protein